MDSNNNDSKSPTFGSRFYLLLMFMCAVLLTVFKCYSFQSSQETLSFTEEDFDDVDGDMQQLGPSFAVTRTLLTTQLAPTHISLFRLLLFPSWERATKSFRADCPHAFGDTRVTTLPENDVLQVAYVVPDLFVACEVESCHYIPPSCVKLTRRNVREKMQRKDNVARCFFAAVRQKDRSYRFLHSLDFLQMEPFTSITKLGIYEYFLRTDTDALIYPGVARLLPKGDGVAGAGYSGSKFTHAVLLQYMKDWKNYTKDDLLVNMQSTFYVHKDKIDEFTSTLINTTIDMLETQFTAENCDRLTKSTIAKKTLKKDEKVCGWPNWHQGVSTLYGTSVAMNTVLSSPGRTHSLDLFGASPNTLSKTVRAVDVIQAHVIFQKYNILDVFSEFPSDICRNPLQKTLLMLEKPSPDHHGTEKNILAEIKSYIKSRKVGGCASSTYEYIGGVIARGFLRSCQVLGFHNGGLRAYERWQEEKHKKKLEQQKLRDAQKDAAP